MLKKILKATGYFLVALVVLLNIMAIFHAYKFTHFYDGIPPAKKPEQMSFSEKAGAIFTGQKYSKSKVVDSFQVKHETIILKTKDSVRLESWYAKST